MIKITFKMSQGDTYWAICECLSCYDVIDGYDLENVSEDSKGSAPAPKINIPPYWKIKQIREVI